MQSTILGLTLTLGLAAMPTLSVSALAQPVPNPVPLINNPLVPDAVRPGGTGFMLTINGTGFAASSVVNWNGSPRVTKFVSGSQVTATILAADVATSTTALVTVTNPRSGGGRSNLGYFQVTEPSAAVAFAASAAFTAGTGPAVSGDLNGDGKLDLVTALEPNIVVMLGNGDGTFQPPTSFACDCNGGALVLADLNHDGKLDIVVADRNSPNVWVLLGKGDGTFRTARNHHTDFSPISIAVGDFKGDGILDLAVVGGTSNSTNLSILLGKGDGTFDAPVPYELAQQPTAVVTGDLDGDGHLDLAISGSGGINGLLGKGDGTFRKPHLTAGVYAGLALADFNGDGILDVAGFSDKAYILLGKGDGTFRHAKGYGAGPNPWALATGDFNGDGIPDLAISNHGTTQMISGFSILLGKGDGTFQHAARTSSLEANTLFPTVGDFNGDGRLDLAVVQVTRPPTESLLSVYLQTAVSLSPNIVSIPTTVVGKTSAPESVTISNLGTAPFSIAGLGIAGANASQFAIVSDACTGTTISPSANCAVSIAFSPAQPGLSTALLTVTDDAVASPQTVPLTGASTVIATSPASLDFGSVRVGGGSAFQFIKVTNAGSSSVQIQDIGITGRDSDDFYLRNSCPATINAKAGCSIAVQFIPTRKGGRKAGIAVVLTPTGPGVNPSVVSLSGTGS